MDERQRVVVVGAGPAGMTASLLLTRKGREVTLVDRDPGPAGDGTWQRRGVMQFEQPHTFRTPTYDVLAGRLPDVLARVVDAGALPMTLGQDGPVIGLRCRRSVVEREMRAAVEAEPGLRTVVGHADRLVVDGDRVRGVVVEGTPVDADLVVAATGRASRLLDGVAPPRAGSPCGMSYVSRMYQLRPGVEPPVLNAPPGYAALADGYLLIVFLHDAGTFTVLVVRADDDAELAALRDTSAWDRAMRVLPGASAWTDPALSEPTTAPRPGGGLTNSYADQPTGLDGLLLVGDAVLTTNPAGGRGVSHALACVAAMVDIVEHRPREAWAGELDAWCAEHLRPWFEDAVRCDAALLRRWAGLPMALDGDLPSDLVIAALAGEPELAPVVASYQQLASTPDSFAPFADRVRERLASGWRPPPSEAPTRAELLVALAAPVGA